MLRKTYFLTLLALAVCIAVLGQAEPAAKLESRSVTFPETNSTFPPGPGADVADNNCLSCHSVEMVMNQPALPKAGWEAEVAKMRNVFKAPIADSDVPAIVEYLTVTKGLR